MEINKIKRKYLVAAIFVIYSVLSDMVLPKAELFKVNN